MAPKRRPPPTQPAAQSWTRAITTTAVIVALLSAIYLFLDSHLEWFYIFSPEQLKDVSQRAIAAHGNDTASVVRSIVDELSAERPGGYVNLDEEWIFNNAGGAMGAMYIIHASESLSDRETETWKLTIPTYLPLYDERETRKGWIWPRDGLAEESLLMDSRCHGVSHYFWYLPSDHASQ
jgi:C-8 sterol isomerase